MAGDRSVRPPIFLSDCRCHRAQAFHAEAASCHFGNGIGCRGQGDCLDVVGSAEERDPESTTPAAALGVLSDLATFATLLSIRSMRHQGTTGTRARS